MNRAAQVNADLLRRNLFGPGTNCGALVADVDGSIAGVGYFHEFQSALSKAPSLWLDDLYVIPRYRSQGIGTDLIEALCCYALENGFQALDFTAQRMNRRGLRLYRRLGAIVFTDTRYCRFTKEVMENMTAEEEKPE